MGSDSVSVTIWGGDLGFVGRNVQESGGGARGVPLTGDSKDVQAAEGRYLEKLGSGECTQRSRITNTRVVH